MVKYVGGLLDGELSAVHDGIEVVNPLLVASIMWSQMTVYHTNRTPVQTEPDASGALVTLWKSLHKCNN